MYTRMVIFCCICIGLISSCLVNAAQTSHAINGVESQRRLYPRVFGSGKAIWNTLKGADRKRKQKNDEPSSATSIVRRPSTRQSLARIPAPPLSGQAPISYANAGPILIAPKDDNPASHNDRISTTSYATPRKRLQSSSGVTIQPLSRQNSVSYVTPNSITIAPKGSQSARHDTSLSTYTGGSSLKHYDSNGPRLKPLSFQSSTVPQRPLTRQNSADSVNSDIILPRLQGPQVVSQDVRKSTRLGSKPPSSYTAPLQQLSRQNSHGVPRPASRQNSFSLPNPPSRQNSYAPLQPLSRQNSFDSVNSNYAEPSRRRQSFSGGRRSPTRIPSPILGVHESELTRKRHATSSLSPSGSRRSSSSYLSSPARPNLRDLPLQRPIDPSRSADRGKTVDANDPRNEWSLGNGQWIRGALLGTSPTRPNVGVLALDGDPKLAHFDADQMQAAIDFGIPMEWNRQHPQHVSTADKKRLRNKLSGVTPASPAVAASNAERRARGKVEYLPEHAKFSKGETPARQHGLNPMHGRDDMRSYFAVPDPNSSQSGSAEWTAQSTFNRGYIRMPDKTRIPIDSLEFRTQNIPEDRWSREIRDRTSAALQQGREELIIPGARWGSSGRYYSEEAESNEERDHLEREARRDARSRQKARDRQADDNYYRSRSRPRPDYD